MRSEAVSGGISGSSGNIGKTEEKEGKIDENCAVFHR
jgi:hypothetical protein